MKTPNFFIIGAPKCGTSALAEYLKQHPNVFFSTPKELNFFNDDQPTRGIYNHQYETKNLTEYMEYFSEADNEYIAVGEGSVNYLRSNVAVSKILSLNPQAQFIVMVRNPVEIAYSFHSQLVRGDEEDILDFEKAWRLQSKRRSGLYIPKYCDEPTQLLYSDIAMLGSQLKRTLAIVPQEQIQTIVYDDFAINPANVYQEVLDFLGLPGDSRKDFPKVNPNRHARFEFARSPIRQTIRISSDIKRKLGIRGGTGILQRIAELNTMYKERPSLSRSFETELRNSFKEDIKLLSHLIDRDLSPWNYGESVGNSSQVRS